MQPGRTATPTARARATILVVDDSPTIRKLVSMTLESKGYRVVLATDGVDGLAKMQEGMPDLILSDITMPRLDGYQFCKVVKSNKDTKHIPVIMLSGNDGLFDKVRGKMVGSANYITKPFEPNHLVSEIEKFVKSDRPAAQPAPTAPKPPAAARPAQQPPRAARDQHVDLSASERLRKNLSGLYIPGQSPSMDMPMTEPQAAQPPGGISAKAPAAPVQQRPVVPKRPIPRRDDEPEIKIYYNNEPEEETPAAEPPPPAQQPSLERPVVPPPQPAVKEFEVGAGLSFKVVTPGQTQPPGATPGPAMPGMRPQQPAAAPAGAERQSISPGTRPAAPAPKQAPQPSAAGPQPGSLSIKAKCTGCGTVYGNIKPQHIGKYANCKKCGARFLIG